MLVVALALLLVQSLGVGQLHWAPPLGWQEQAYWTGLAELKAAGRIREVGLSNYGPEGVTRAHRYLAKLDTQLASNQVIKAACYCNREAPLFIALDPCRYP